MSSSRKRKHHEVPNPSLNHGRFHYAAVDELRESSPDPVLYIKAHEADIIRGPHAVTAAMSLEANGMRVDTMTSSSIAGDALMLWGGSQSMSQPLFPGDEDDFHQKTIPHTDEAGPAIWVDRYDARLLLDTLPSTQQPAILHSAPDALDGWSDLPSDNEDMFFFSPEEAEDLRRDKKRRHIEQLREERLKARLAEDGEEATVEEEVWGGSDEEPDDTQKALMRRTAIHLLSSPNTAQLEMRILANHGSDRRFAFLRGRWSRKWRTMKVEARVEKEKEKREVAVKPLGVLAGYGDSDAESSEDGGNQEQSATEGQPVIDMAPAVAEPQPITRQTSAPPPSPRDVEDAAKSARRARAKKWAEKRRQQGDQPI